MGIVIDMETRRRIGTYSPPVARLLLIGSGDGGEMRIEGEIVDTRTLTNWINVLIALRREEERRQ